MTELIAGRKRKATEDERVIDGYDAVDPSSSGRNTRSLVTRSVSRNAGLCRRCARLGIDKITPPAKGPTSGYIWATLSTVSTWSEASCSLCRMMSDILKRHNAQDSYHTISPELWLWQSADIHSFGWSSVNKTLLCFEGTDEYIVQQAVGAKGPIRILKPNDIKYDVLKGWINMCKDMHTKACAVNAQSTTTVPHFTLIDCKTLRVVSGSNEPYVALSYVWGQVTPGGLEGDRLPDKLPQTIKDSITVTLNLGFRYIWVDTFCNSPIHEVRTAQIQKMDLIYQNAQVTIVACAGDDMNYGLPGVSLRDRQLQGHTLVNGHLLISSLSDPQTLITDSKWSTRAWTYQEGLLSLRRLVFTDQQVYFECHGMYCCESMDFPLKDMHTKNHQSFRKLYCTGEGIGYFPKGLGRSPWEVVQRIKEYSRLTVNLTDPEDVLKGILGILNAFAGGTFKIRHYQGIPLLPAVSPKGKLSCDSWTSDMGFCSGLCWDLKSPSTRRELFPSWSWTGWMKPDVEWGDEKSEWGQLKVDEDIKVLVETSTGQKIGLEESLLLQDKHQLSNVIQITAWASSLRILQRPARRREKEYDVRIKREDGGRIIWRFKPTSNIELSPERRLIGIHIAYRSESTNHLEATASALLVVGKVGDIYERVGFGWVRQNGCGIFDKDGEDTIQEDLWRSPETHEPLGLVRSRMTIMLR